MKRIPILFLPLMLLALASCGTAARYSQQRFQDGIYAKPGEETPSVRLYTEEDFEAMAAANIARKQGRDTLVVVLEAPYSPWAWGGAGFGTYYWNRWRFGHRFGPWYGGFGYGWYDPWFAGWYDPWYYGPWYYDPWYGGYGWYGAWHDPWYGWYGWNGGWYDPWHGWHGRPGYPGGAWGGAPHRGNTVYAPRSLTQSGGSRVGRPGSGYNYRYGTAGSAGGSIVGGRGTAAARPGRNGAGGTSSASSSSAANRSRSAGYNPSRSYGSGEAASGARSYSNSSSYNNNAARSSGSYNNGGASRSGGFGGGGSFGGSSSRSGGGGNGGSRSGGGRR